LVKALIATCFWGISFIAIRVALESAEPFGVVWMRNGLGALVLLVLIRLRGLELLPAKEDRARCLLLGVLVGVHFFIQTLSMQMTTAMRAGWIIAFIPVVVAVGALVFLRQRMRAIGWLGIAAATCGVLVLTSTRPEQLARAGTGDLLMVVSTFTWAAYSLSSIGPTQRNGGLRVSALTLAVSAVPNVIAAGFFGTWHAEPTARTIGALLFLAVCSSGLAMWLFADVLADLGPERAASFQYLQPFVTVVASFVLLDEPFTAAQFIGGPIVLAGVWCVQRGKSGVSATVTGAPTPPRPASTKDRGPTRSAGA
jgi:drug/metabolite transporter (DMT)-like permease